ncbi:MAG: hypothetical protein ABJA37_13725, partial [Ferruginibacter sp.]
NAVVAALQKLEEDEYGCAIANHLKKKYWAGIYKPESFNGATAYKNKSEISQRFYFFDGEAGISVEDAHRFLLNRWKEKEMQLKKKEDAVTETADAEKAGGNTGLLQKKRSRIKSVNNKRMHQH